MARADDIGLFWQDIPAERGTRSEVSRPIPPIPATSWRPPDYFPDLSGAGLISLDLETYDPELTTKGPGPRRDGYIAGIAVGTDDGFRGYYPIRHKMGGNLDSDKVLGWLHDQLYGTDIPKVGANLLYDLDFLSAAGVDTGDGPNYDVQNAEPLLDEYKRSYALDILGNEYLGEGKTSEALYRWSAAAYGGQPTSRDQGRNIWRCPVELVGPYAEGDVDLPIRIFEMQKKRLEDEQLWGVFELETRLIPLLLAMRQRGVRIDFEQAGIVERQLDGYIKELNKNLGGINVNAGDEIARMCDKAGIKYPRTKPTKGSPNGNPSFQKDWLKNHPDPRMKMISEARTYLKYRDTFITSYLHGNQINGRIHCLFNQLRSDDLGTVSGRFSSSNPNLQNIPKRGKGKIMRSPFVPEEGEIWGRFDWSQIEFRLLVNSAMGRGAEEAVRMYNEDATTDFHVMVQELTGLDRDPAKNINFGLCIAEGQRVLTDMGWMPIEQVSLANRVWDGLNWVRHDGLIHKGLKNVVNYSGLRATKEHIIYTKRFGALPFGRCSSERKEVSRRDCTPGVSDGLRYTKGSNRNDKASTYKERQGYRLLLQCLRKDDNSLRGQYPSRFNNRVQVSTHGKEKEVESTARNSKILGRSLRRNHTEVQYVVSRIIEQLYRSRNKVPVRISRALHNLGFRDIPGLELQGYGLRPNRQRRSLLTRESTTDYEVGKPAEQGEQVNVYDLLNAGPNHRFICEGVLVSNCYGMGLDLLCSILGVSRERGQEILDIYFSKVPFVKKTYDEASRAAKNRGYIKTLLGRRARFPNGEYTHKALNRHLQGGAADIMKTAMVDIWESGICDVLGAPLLTVHDELDWSVPRTDEAEEAMAECKHIMETCVKLKVPLVAEEERGLNWATCKGKGEGGYFETDRP